MAPRRSRATSSALRSKKLCGRGAPRRMAASVAGTGGRPCTGLPSAPAATTTAGGGPLRCGSALLFTLLLLRGGAALRSSIRGPGSAGRIGCGLGCGVGRGLGLGGAALPGPALRALRTARLGRTRLPRGRLGRTRLRRSRLRRARLRRARLRGAAPGAAGLLRGVCLHGTLDDALDSALTGAVLGTPAIEQRFRAVGAEELVHPVRLRVQDAEDGFRAERLDDGLCGLLPDPAVAPGQVGDDPVRIGREPRA